MAARCCFLTPLASFAILHKPNSCQPTSSQRPLKDGYPRLSSRFCICQVNMPYLQVRHAHILIFRFQSAALRSSSLCSRHVSRNSCSSLESKRCKQWFRLRSLSLERMSRQYNLRTLRVNIHNERAFSTASRRRKLRTAFNTTHHGKHLVHDHPRVI